MQYRLLKDLPGYKAGTVFKEAPSGSYFPIGSDTTHTMYEKLFRWQEMNGEWFEEVPEEPKRWRAAKGDYYYAITIDSYDNLVNRSRDDRDKYDQARYEVGNYFQTEKQAEAALEATKALLGFIQADGKDNGQWPALVSLARQIVAEDN